MEKPTFKEALQFWLKLGFISFGGPAGQIAIMHEDLVEKKKWISDSKFVHALNYCMILPGPEAQQLAIYIGWLLHGTLGGLAAGILFVLPSMFILLTLSILYASLGNLPWVYAIFWGQKPAVIAIIILALFKIGKKALLSPFHYGAAMIAFVGIFFFNLPFPLIIIATIIVAILARHFFPSIFETKANATHQKEVNEADFYLNKYSIIPHTHYRLPSFLQKIGISIVFWFIPFILFYYLTNDFDFWKTLSLFFTKAAFVTFGGAYAVLPYVAQVSVERFHWLSNLQMIDGLALGETTPGPLIMLLAFVGFMAGYNHFGNSLAMGTIGLITTTFYTFLPCFLFIFVGAPLIEKTQENKKIKEILSLVSAAVVGVILNLSLYLGKAVIFPQEMMITSIDYFSIVWIISSFIALHHFKINMIVWIGISAAFGLTHHFLFFILEHDFVFNL